MHGSTLISSIFLIIDINLLGYRIVIQNEHIIEHIIGQIRLNIFCFLNKSNQKRTEDGVKQRKSKGVLHFIIFLISFQRRLVTMVSIIGGTKK